MRSARENTDGGRSGANGGVDVDAALAHIDHLLAGLAPELVPERIAPQALRGVIGRLAAIERRARGAKLLLRQAAADSGAWKANGARSAADDVAREEGMSSAQARAEIEASGRLANLPAARDAVGRGEMSVEKAKAVAEGAAADPASEGRLVETARTGDLRSTQDAARQAVIRSDERTGGGRAEGVRKRRSLKTWLNLDGEGHGHWCVPPDMHHRFMAALEPYIRQARRNARAAGLNLTPEAINADALDLLARDVLLDDHSNTSDGPTSPPDGPMGAPGPAEQKTPRAADDDRARGSGAGSAAPDASATRERDGGTAGAPAVPARRRRAAAQGIVLVDLDALRRGYAADGETCEIQGLGPVPVEMARDMMRDALLRLVVAGTDVTVVSTVTRHVPEAVRIALLARDKGRCVVPGCGATRGLQMDHAFVDFARGGPTRLTNLDLLCGPDHFKKTHLGWTLGWDAETGWSFTPPEPRSDPP